MDSHDDHVDLLCGRSHEFGEIKNLDFDFEWLVLINLCGFVDAGSLILLSRWLIGW